jgi:hypothetical protein
MTGPTIDLDDKVIAASAQQLATSTKVDTVNAALVLVANRQRLAQSLDPLIGAAPSWENSMFASNLGRLSSARGGRGGGPIKHGVACDG